PFAWCLSGAVRFPRESPRGGEAARPSAARPARACWSPAPGKVQLRMLRAPTSLCSAGGQRVAGDSLTRPVRQPPRKPPLYSLLCPLFSVDLSWRPYTLSPLGEETPSLRLGIARAPEDQRPCRPAEPLCGAR